MSCQNIARNKKPSSKQALMRPVPRPKPCVDLYFYQAKTEKHVDSRMSSELHDFSHDLGHMIGKILKHRGRGKGHGRATQEPEINPENNNQGPWPGMRPGWGRGVSMGSLLQPETSIHESSANGRGRGQSSGRGRAQNLTQEDLDAEIGTSGHNAVFIGASSSH
ncbi:hypothetical protein L6452_22598 [Arctium lappa]|uniref:Uncharacterized protein n=1 Tax=Arctium lappa TaxID=4217 RepID=A0ACB9AZE0_ARCLA|nr:hypothetical protein L6452_22598 [Arctium lappa]